MVNTSIPTVNRRMYSYRDVIRFARDRVRLLAG